MYVFAFQTSRAQITIISLNTNHSGAAVEGWTIFIRGLHEEIREEDVKDKFADCGDITEFHMPLDRASGYVKVREDFDDLIFIRLK